MSSSISFAMLPAAAVSGIYFSPPEAKYFATGKEEEAERWLAPVLSY